MVQRKWILRGAPPIPSFAEDDDSRYTTVTATNGTQQRVKLVGIAGLEKRGIDVRKRNEAVIGSVVDGNLDSLMALAKEVTALAESLGRQTGGGSDADAEANAVLAESAQQLGLVTTKDIVGGGGSSELYLSELARNVAEYLTDDKRGVLRRAGGIITLVDLWATFNRARGGVELVSPKDFHQAAQLWERLRLPVRLRAFRSGVLVVQGSDRTDEATVRALLALLRERRAAPPDHDVSWDWAEYGQGLTAQDVGDKFGWSLGVAQEELEMAEDRGVLCRDLGVEGVRFWENLLDTPGDRDERKRAAKEQAQEIEDKIIKSLKAAGFA
jgi:ESCRT-II complex subunit VPS36